MGPSLASAAAFPGVAAYPSHREQTTGEAERNLSMLAPHPVAKEPLMRCPQHLEWALDQPSSPTLALSSAN